jgi:hypothetical protein
LVVSDTFPDAAVTSIAYVPAGVPVDGLTCGLELLAGLPQAASMDAIARSITATNCRVYRRAGSLAIRRPSQADARRNAMAQGKSGGGQPLRGKNGISPAECGIVVMESVTFVLWEPAGSESGEKTAVAFGGSGEVENVTLPPSEPFAGATASVKLAGWPAATVEAGVGALTLKSATARASAEVVPPPGNGLFTAIFSVPPGVITLAGRTAVSEVALTKVVAKAALPA